MTIRTSYDEAFMDELERAPLKAQQIARQLAQPVHNAQQNSEHIRLCQRGLTLIRQEYRPLMWAVFQVALANALRAVPDGDQAENLEQAISAYTAAIEVYAGAGFRKQWAIAQNNLGVTLSDRVKGDHAENLERAIAAYQAALKVYTRSTFPEEWAMTQINLGNALCDRVLGDQEDNLERAIAACTSALEVYTRAEYPIGWARAQMNLSRVLRRRIRGDREENVRQARAASAAAQQVRMQAEMACAPPDVRLVISQLQRPTNDSREQMRRAQLIERALALVDRRDSPLLWAALQGELGNYLQLTHEGDRAENLERALAAYQAVLEVRTQDDSPVKWALTQHNLGSALYERIRGDRAENLERAIAAYTAALEVRVRTDFPTDWARTQESLGSAYTDRIRGDRVENLERAIAAFQAALEVYTRNEFPEEWARIRRKLLDAVRERAVGNRATDLLRTVAGYMSAVKSFVNADSWAKSRRVVEARPELLAPEADAVLVYLIKTQEDARVGQLLEEHRQLLARCRTEGVDEAFSKLVRMGGPKVAPRTTTRPKVDVPSRFREHINRLQTLSSTPEGIEQQIAVYEDILRSLARYEAPAFWSATQNNLGNAYSQRIQGDQMENQERAIAAYTAALEVYAQDVFPFEWASTQNNLGNAYSRRIKASRAENLERAITAYQASLEVYTQNEFPKQWAMVHNNLAGVYPERIQGDRAENLERAIAACVAALEVRTQTDFPVDWAATQHNLGNAYSKRIKGDPMKNQECAIAACTAALEVYTQNSSPVDWAMIQESVGTIYAERSKGSRVENLERAIAAFRATLEVYTRTGFPVNWARIQNNLGGACFELAQTGKRANLEQAVVALKAAIDGAQAAGIRADELLAARNLGSLYYGERQWLSAYEAFNTARGALEARRTAYFTEAAKAHLAEENALLYARLTDTCLRLDPPHVKETLEQAEAGKGRMFLDQLGTDAFPTPPLPPAQQPLLKREASLISEFRMLEHAIRNARGEDQQRHFVAQQGEKRAALDEVWSQLDLHAPDYVALRRGDPAKYDDLQAMVNGFGPAATLVEFYTLPDKIIVFVLRSGEQEPAVIKVPLSQGHLRRHVRTYWREVVGIPHRGDIGQRWQELAKPLLGDILPHLDGAELVYLVPHGLLHYLPLHALQADGDYLIDRFAIAYAPSAAVLNRVIQRRAEVLRKGLSKALVAGDPTHNLRYAEAEAKHVAQLFGVQPYLGEKATKSTIQSEVADKNVVHLACHGYFHPTQPLQSCIVFAGEETLTAQEIMGLRLQADLVTLSACETGQSEVSRGDELVGLTRALLYAGASSVLVSLWRVHDESTGQLMADFYRRLYDNTGRKVKAEAVALREAMLEVRKKREHPYYWAPFVLIGDWR